MRTSLRLASTAAAVAAAAFLAGCTTYTTTAVPVASAPVVRTVPAYPYAAPAVVVPVY